MKKTYLLTPGPTAIPENITSIFARPIIHHRTPEFQALFKDVCADLKYLFQTQNDVLILTCTGTGAMDAAVCNLFRRGDKVITINGGKFGERWTRICQAYGLGVVEMKLPWGDAADPALVTALAAEHPDARAILFQASETSTGVQMPVKELCEVAHKANMLAVCDAITALGVFDLQMDNWGIDVLITGSQKALMLPPGLALIALSERAWKYTESCNLPHFYFDLPLERKNLSKNQTAWTPAISLIQGLHEALRMIKAETLPVLFKRHERLARATREGVKAIGLEILARKAPSTAVTAVVAPGGAADGKKIVKHMSERYGVTIIGGQDEYEGKIFRLAHIGYCDKFDITTALAALELTLNDLGYKVEHGKAVGAALKVLGES